ncbi:lipase chaperone [Acinetobacter sp. CFCC 10889]|uniref:defense against restriction DarA-related protein n=1 Tax=Acinetobacter sp. CFCC 10889 TaxID=1775557 RepID=UPI0013A69F7C|nr:lipase chaperone [Acinetobacter sp. CFCC 10889]
MAKHDVFKVQHETGTTRSIQFANGTVTQDRCIANIGELQGQSRNIPAILCDGAVEQDHWNIVNLVDENGMFLNHVAVRGAVSENQQNELIERYFQPILADSVVHSSHVLTDGGLQRFLDEKLTPSNTDFLLLDDANHFNHRVTKITPLWDEDQITSHNGRVGEFLLDMVRHDDQAELLEHVTPQDLIAILLDGTEGMLADAMMLEYKQFDRVIKKLGDALQKQGDQEFNVANVTPIAPFKKNGVVNVGVIFEMNDTQTVTVLFNNPDSTPAKLTPSDVLTSWKWMLNKRDVTAALQPKAKESTRYTLIAKRMMQLLVKNHGRFQRAAGERLRIDRELQEAQTLVDQKKQTLLDMDQQIADEQAKIDAFMAEKQQNNNADVTPDTKMQTLMEKLKSLGFTAENGLNGLSKENIAVSLDWTGEKAVVAVDNKQVFVSESEDETIDFVKSELSKNTTSRINDQYDIEVMAAEVAKDAEMKYYADEDSRGKAELIKNAMAYIKFDLPKGIKFGDFQKLVELNLNDVTEPEGTSSEEPEQDLINDWENKIPPELDQEKFKQGMDFIQKHIEKNGIDWNTADAFKFVANTSLKFLGADQSIAEFADVTSSLINTGNTMSRQLFAIHTNGKVVLGSKGKKASQEALEQYALEHFTAEQQQAFTEQQKQAEIERVKAKQQETLNDIKLEIVSIWNALKDDKYLILDWMKKGFRPQPTKVGAIMRFKFVNGDSYYPFQNNKTYRSLERMIKASNQIYGSFENALIELGAWKPETAVPEQQPEEVTPDTTAQPETAAAPEQSPDETYLNQVIQGSIDLSGQDVGDRLEQIGENLPPELEPLFEQAADAYAAFAIENAKRAG